MLGAWDRPQAEPSITCAVIDARPGRRETIEITMFRLLVALSLVALAAPMAVAQQPAPRPPAVGVTKVARQPMTPSSEFVGRIEAVERVALVARVTAFMDKRLFTEGTEVKKGDLLYRLEQPPFQADLQAKQSLVAQYNAQLQNAAITLTRQRTLLSSPAGQQSAVDLAQANQGALQAQVLGAQAQLRQSQINLDYTEIHAPIDGKIGRTAVTPGNVVSPSSGVLTTIVSQDPMYVVFPVPARTALDLRERYGAALQGAILKVRMSNGQVYGRVGKLDFFDNTVSGNTDTITLRGVMPNPELASKPGEAPARGLIDGELITAVIEDSAPVEVMTIPRAAVLSDQAGDYVYVVDAQDKVQQQRIKLGQSQPTVAVVASGLSEGDTVVLEGIQRIRPGMVVSPGPAGAPPGAPAPKS
jgi:membrane fusion protein (multidrug efflux system)